MEWQTRLKRFFSFLSLGYEPHANTVVITLRLNSSFVLGAVVAAVLLTLVFRHGGISLGGVLELLSDLWRSGFWLWAGIGITVAVLALMRRGQEPTASASAGTGFWSNLTGRLPKGPRGTALLCIALLAVLILLMYGASGDTAVAPSPEAERAGHYRPRPAGEETPALWRDLQKGKRP